jgi:UDP-N-acetylmuramoyl-L-alanyl-D-glutamate--2,6-diaminopimelate ligase
MGINESSRSKWVLSENRGSAITEAISKADNDDLILVAGKGHENYQIIKTKKIFLDDSVEVQSAFKIRNKN